MQDFRHPAHLEITERINAALSLLHRRDDQSGRQELERAERALHDMDVVRPSIRHVLGRMYHGVLSYYFYCVGRFREAGDELEVARDCVRHAVDSERLLLPFTLDCLEFHLHHARIARNQRSWHDMRRHLEIVHGMIENRLPLCTLSDGTRVDYAALAAHYATLPLDREAREGLRPVLDLAIRRDLLERFIMRVYWVPGFVIPA